MRDVLLLLLQVLYLFAPLLVAAALSGVVLRFDLFPKLRRPIDAGRTFRGRRLLGDSKTWRGVVVAIVGCITAVALQKHVIAGRIGSIAVVDYRSVDVLLFGAAMGGGAMAGELPNSFVKRRLGIAPGETTNGVLAVVFYAWDQLDLLTTTWPLLACWLEPTLPLVATSIALALVVHPTVALIGYLIGARRSPR